MDKYLRKKTQAPLQDKIEELAAKYGLDVKDVTNICNAPFEYMKYSIVNNSEGFNFPVIKIPGFMNFYVKDTKIEWFKKNAKEKEDAEEVLSP